MGHPLSWPFLMSTAASSRRHHTALDGLVLFVCQFCMLQSLKELYQPNQTAQHVKHTCQTLLLNLLIQVKQCGNYRLQGGGCRSASHSPLHL